MWHILAIYKGSPKWSLKIPKNDLQKFQKKWYIKIPKKWSLKIPKMIFKNSKKNGI